MKIKFLCEKMNNFRIILQFFFSNYFKSSGIFINSDQKSHQNLPDYTSSSKKRFEVNKNEIFPSERMNNSGNSAAPNRTPGTENSNFMRFKSILCFVTATD